ncbi:MAG: cation transporter [Chthonomonas sp.]|nr:cation transporter [Chthonomonas sp.]
MANAERAVEQGAQLSLGLTTLNVLGKVIAGTLSGSVSVLAEGLQSAVDVLISYGVLQAIRVSARPPDPEHPYGHGKAEVLLAAGQMIVISITAIIVAAQATRRLIHPEPITVDYGLIAMAASTLINLALSLHLARVARQHGSSALSSEVTHLRGDMFASLGILLGLIAVKLTGWKQLDPLIAIAFMAFVIVSALLQLRKLLHPLMDGALPRHEVTLIEDVLHSHPDARGFHALKTRAVGSERYVDLHLLLDDHLSFVEAHDLAEAIEDQISHALGGAIVNAHYEPYHAEMRHQAEAHAEQNEAAPQ